MGWGGWMSYSSVCEGVCMYHSDSRDVLGTAYVRSRYRKMLRIMI